MKYRQITINTTHDFSELAAEVLTEAGSEGVVITDDEEMRSILKNTHWDYVDEKLLGSCSPVVRVSGFFDVGFDISVIENELLSVRERSEFDTGSLELTSLIIDSCDWENVWKKYYKPIKIKNISVVPMWLKNTHKNTTPVFINPGMAFGTGSHETTSMCIELMQSVPLKDKLCADVGCGSGILGVCALKLGAKKCLFTDTDPNAVRAAEENCSYNGVAGAEIITGSLLEQSGERFNLVLANLTADLLTMLYRNLSAHVENSGKIIISGIIKERLDEVKKVYSGGFNVLKEISKGEWRALLMEKK